MYLERRKPGSAELGNISTRNNRAKQIFCGRTGNVFIFFNFILKTERERECEWGEG